MSKSNLLIFLDSNHLTLGLIDDQKLLTSKRIELHQNLIEKFFSQLKLILQNNKLKIQDIKKIYVSTGPGSFISNRILSVFLKTSIILAPQIQVFALNKLLWMVGNHGQKIALLKVNQNFLHYQVFINGKPVTKNEIIKNDELTKIQQNYSDFKIVSNLFANELIDNFFLLKDRFVKVEWTNLQIDSLQYLKSKK